MIPDATLYGGGQQSRAAPGRGRPFTALVLLLKISSLRSVCLILLFANFLASALASQRRLHAFLFTGLQVKRMAVDLFDDIFLLHFALEAAQSVLEGFTLLQSNFRQTDTPPNPSGRTVLLLQLFTEKSSAEYEKNCRMGAVILRTGDLVQLSAERLGQLSKMVTRTRA